MLTIDEVIKELTHVSDAPRQMCSIQASIASSSESVCRLVAYRGDRQREVTLPHSAVQLLKTSSDTAIVDLPFDLAVALDLDDFTLSDREIAKRRGHAEMFNSPLLKITSDKKPERIGNIRI